MVVVHDGFEYLCYVGHIMMYMGDELPGVYKDEYIA